MRFSDAVWNLTRIQNKDDSAEMECPSSVWFGAFRKRSRYRQCFTSVSGSGLQKNVPAPAYKEISPHRTAVIDTEWNEIRSGEHGGAGGTSIVSWAIFGDCRYYSPFLLAFKKMAQRTTASVRLIFIGRKLPADVRLGIERCATGVHRYIVFNNQYLYFKLNIQFYIP